MGLAPNLVALMSSIKSYVNIKLKYYLLWSTSGLKLAETLAMVSLTLVDLCPYSLSFSLVGTKLGKCNSLSVTSIWLLMLTPKRLEKCLNAGLKGQMAVSNLPLRK